MTPREAIRELLKLEQDVPILDEYAEDEIIRFYSGTYDDSQGTHECVYYELREPEADDEDDGDEDEDEEGEE